MEDVIIAAAFAGAVLALFSPYLGMLVYLAFLILRPTDWYLSLQDTNFVRLLGMVLAVAFLLHGHWQNRLRVRHTFWFGLMLVAIALSAVTGWFPVVMGRLYDMARNFFLFVVVISLAQARPRIRLIVWSLLGMAAVMAFDTVSTYGELVAAFEGEGTLRLAGWGAYFGEAGDFALMMNTIVPIAIFTALAEGNLLLKAAGLGVGSLCLAAMTMSGSRGSGVIAFGAVILGILAVTFWRARSGGPRWAGVAVATGLVLALFLVASPVFLARAETIAAGAYTARIRLTLWIIGVKLFLMNPLFGVGAGNFLYSLDGFGLTWSERFVAHNFLVQAAAETGILGIASILMLVGLAFRDGFASVAARSGESREERWARLMASGLTVALVAQVVGGFFQTVLYYPLLYLLMGLLVVLRHYKDAVAARAAAAAA